MAAEREGDGGMAETGKAYTLGIDIGASSVKLAALGIEGAVAYTAYELHKGDAASCLRDQLCKLEEKLGFRGCCGIRVTGSGSGLLAERGMAIEALGDVPALTRGADIIAPEARSIVQIGGQSACYIVASDCGEDAPESPQESFWQCGVPEFAMNESCAAGTGSFFEDQMERLGLSIEDYSELVSQARSIPRLSGRCAVFAKTDIIHRQQEGASVEDILLGLCYALVKSYKATVVRSLALKKPLVFAGGVVRNAGVRRALSEVFGLGEDELVCGPETEVLQAIGAAAAARDAGVQDSAAQLLSELRFSLVGTAQAADLPRLPRLVDTGYRPEKGFREKPRPWGAGLEGAVSCALGVDVGSTSTNLVLVDEEGELLDAQYLRTRGNPKEAVKQGLSSIEQRLGAQVRVVSVGVTGSGRSMIGDMIGADVVRDEITAQGRAAIAADPSVDTVFEIGGQDSKYIFLRDGQVADFQMNKICAAGTGSFVEEQARRLDIPLDEYGDLAFSSSAPVDLGERCTVFVETAINAALSAGAGKEDIAAGLALSIVRNYLHKVVGTKPVGSHIVLQGGVAFNPAIVAAFRQLAGDALTVSPWFAVSGAVGAALLALEERAAAAGTFKTAFRGFDLSGRTEAHAASDADEIAANRAFFRKTEELYLEGYDPSIYPEKQTVGIPRCLMMHKLFPLANAFFRELGYNVIVTDASAEETVSLAQQLAQGEVCYPVKLLYGHMEQLARAGVDYIFMPRMHTIRHAMSKVAHNYACPYMQIAPQFIARTLRLEQRGVQLLSPLMNMDFGQQALAEALLGMGQQLGHTPRESARAMMAGGKAVQEFTRKTEELGEQLLASLKPGERVLVLVTRQYNTADPELNMGIADALLDRGQKVITVSHLHAHDLDISQDYPHMYWPFGQHLLSGAKLVRRDPRLFAVYLTNHGCGPDTMVSHLFAEEMGDKPYLQIEMDEHFSQVGVITRIEAFLNALDHSPVIDESALPLSVKHLAPERLHLDEPIVLPSLGPYGPLLATWLEARGAAQVHLMRPTPEALAAARKELVSKEYYSFAVLLGMSLQACGLVQGAGHDQAARQLLLPSSEGAEADGVYERVVRSILDAKGQTDVRIVAPSMEQLAWASDDAEGLFAALLAGDVCQAAPPNAREGLLEWFAEEPPAFERVLEGARRAAAAWEREVSSKRQLALVGEWWCACTDELSDGVGAYLEDEGWHIVRMPLAEYLLFSWYDALDEDFPAAADEPEAQERYAVLDRLSSRLSAVHDALGDASPYCAEFSALRTLADALMEGYRGANGRYRAAKLGELSDTIAGVLVFSSLYENTDIALGLSGGIGNVPVLRLSFDGVLDRSAQEKLDSFLYYL